MGQHIFGEQMTELKQVEMRRCKPQRQHSLVQKPTKGDIYSMASTALTYLEMETHRPTLAMGKQTWGIRKSRVWGKHLISREAAKCEQILPKAQKKIEKKRKKGKLVN